MLQAMTWASPPSLRMPLATSSQASALRLEITTLAPSRASNSAEERPMPRLEPVMTATLPVRSNGVDFTVRTPFRFCRCSFRYPARHARPCAGHPRLAWLKTWMAGSSPAMTMIESFRDGPKDQTRNLEIPRCAVAHLRFALRAPRNDGAYINPPLSV